MTDAELRSLLNDCMALWGVNGWVVVGADGMQIATGDGGAFLVRRAPPGMRPVRWFLQTPERRAADRPPRAVPSIVALLAALRNALGADAGNRLIVASRRSQDFFGHGRT